MEKRAIIDRDTPDIERRLPRMEKSGQAATSNTKATVTALDDDFRKRAADKVATRGR